LLVGPVRCCRYGSTTVISIVLFSTFDVVARKGIFSCTIVVVIVAIAIVFSIGVSLSSSLTLCVAIINGNVIDSAYRSTGIHVETWGWTVGYSGTAYVNLSRINGTRSDTRAGRYTFGCSAAGIQQTDVHGTWIDARSR
jgi:hypothetical protein